jgi:hypothetical protein
MTKTKPPKPKTNLLPLSELPKFLTAKAGIISEPITFGKKFPEHIFEPVQNTTRRDVRCAVTIRWDELESHLLTMRWMCLLNGTIFGIWIDGGLVGILRAHPEAKQSLAFKLLEIDCELRRKDSEPSLTERVEHLTMTIHGLQSTVNVLLGGARPVKKRRHYRKRGPRNANLAALESPAVDQSSEAATGE